MMTILYLTQDGLSRNDLAYIDKWFEEGLKLWKDLNFGTWETARPYWELIEKVILKEHKMQPILATLKSEEILCVVNGHLSRILFKHVFDHWEAFSPHFNITRHNLVQDADKALNFLIENRRFNLNQQALLTFLQNELNRAGALVSRMLIELIRKETILTDQNILHAFDIETSLLHLNVRIQYCSINGFFIDLGINEHVNVVYADYRIAPQPKTYHFGVELILHIIKTKRERNENISIADFQDKKYTSMDKINKIEYDLERVIIPRYFYRFRSLFKNLSFKEKARFIILSDIYENREKKLRQMIFNACRTYIIKYRLNRFGSCIALINSITYLYERKISDDMRQSTHRTKDSYVFREKFVFLKQSIKEVKRVFYLKLTLTDFVGNLLIPRYTDHINTTEALDQLRNIKFTSKENFLVHYLKRKWYDNPSRKSEVLLTMSKDDLITEMRNFFNNIQDILWRPLSPASQCREFNSVLTIPRCTCGTPIHKAFMPTVPDDNFEYMITSSWDQIIGSRSFTVYEGHGRHTHKIGLVVGEHGQVFLLTSIKTDKKIEKFKNFHTTHSRINLVDVLPYTKFMQCWHTIAGN